MSTAKPRSNMGVLYIGLFIVIFALIILSFAEVKESRQIKANEAAKQARYDAFIEGLSQKITVVQQDQQRFGKDIVDIIQTTPTKEEMDIAIKDALKQPTALCIWNQPDIEGNVVVTCKSNN